MSKQPGARQRHTFIQFYMNDWLAGTARMARPVRSVYLDVCCYTWDKVQPVPKGVLALMLMDLEGMGPRIIDSLVDTGQLVRNEDGSVYSPRAMAEAERAFAAWQAKSRGGKAKSAGSDLEDSSKSLAAERERERDRDKEKKEPPLPPADKSALPEDFTPVLTERANEHWHALINPERELEKFKSHHQSKGSKMKDWQAAFRTWLANAVTYQEERRDRGNGNSAGEAGSGNAFVNAALEREAARAAGKS